MNNTLRISTTVGTLQLQPWQVTRVAWMQKQEQSALAGGILADECGLGKTITCLQLVLDPYFGDFALGQVNCWIERSIATTLF